MLPEGHPFRTIRAEPAGPTSPEPWILGSSAYGTQVTAHFGVPYCFAHFITDGQGAAEALDMYRGPCHPSAAFPAPLPALAVWAMAAETAAQAEWQYASRALWRLGRDRGVYTPLPSPEEAAAYPSTEAERHHTQSLRQTVLTGTGTQVADKLREVGSQHGVTEIAILTTLYSKAPRQRSYSLISEALARHDITLAAE